MHRNLTLISSFSITFLWSRVLSTVSALLLHVFIASSLLSLLIVITTWNIIDTKCPVQGLVYMVYQNRCHNKGVIAIVITTIDRNTQICDPNSIRNLHYFVPFKVNFVCCPCIFQRCHVFINATNFKMVKLDLWYCDTDVPSASWGYRCWYEVHWSGICWGRTDKKEYMMVMQLLFLILPILLILSISLDDYSCLFNPQLFVFLSDLSINNQLFTSLFVSLSPPFFLCNECSFSPCNAWNVLFNCNVPFKRNILVKFK